MIDVFCPQINIAPPPRPRSGELAELASDLHRRGVDPFSILLACGRRATLLAKLGTTLPADAPLSAVRALPGLETWQPMVAWAKRTEKAGGRNPDALAEGIPDPPFEELKRRSRAYVLADWLRFRAGSLIAEEVVVAAEAIAHLHVGEGVADG